jgi:serine/threonine protein kinase
MLPRIDHSTIGSGTMEPCATPGVSSRMGSPAPLRTTVALDDDARAPASLDLLAARDDTRWLTENYALYGELGRGGMSTVYLATERATGRQVAVKVLDQQDEVDPDTERHFECEARSAALLHHPNIVETLAVGTYGGCVVAIINAYVRGQSLRRLLEESGPLPFARAIQILRDVAAALAHAHQARIVHCDVKPANILIEADTGRALLTDFGIACDLDAGAQRASPGHTVGTPAYMAPEQIAGLDVDERSDVYALGVVAWEMLAGAEPWQGESMSGVLFRQRYELLPDLAAIRPDIPAFLLNAINTALSKNRMRRQPDAAAFLAQLDPTPVPLEVLTSSDGGATDESPADATVRFAPPTRDGMGAPPGDASSFAPPPAHGTAASGTLTPEMIALIAAESPEPEEPEVIPRIATEPPRRVRIPRPAVGRVVEVVIALWCVLALGALGMTVLAPDTVVPIVDRITGHKPPVDTALDSMLTQAVTRRVEHPGARVPACRTAREKKSAACRAVLRGRRSRSSSTLHHTSARRSGIRRTRP